MSSISSSDKKMVNLDINKAVEIIFNKDSAYSVKEMSMNGIDNAEEAFWFLTKILKNGIIYMFKDDKGNVDIDKLTNEDFISINDCMQKLGINVEIQVFLGSTNNFVDSFHHQKYIENTVNSDLNVAMSYMQIGDKEKLENHILILFTRTKKIIIGYTFISE